MKQELLDKLIEMRKAGSTFKELANEYTILSGKSATRQYIQAILKGKVPVGETKYKQYYEDWAKMYLSGVSMEDISKKYNCNIVTVHKALKKKVRISASLSAKERFYREVKEGTCPIMKKSPMERR